MMLNQSLKFLVHPHQDRFNNNFTIDQTSIVMTVNMKGQLVMCDLMDCLLIKIGQNTHR